MFLHWQSLGPRISTYFFNLINFNTNAIIPEHLYVDVDQNIYSAFNIDAQGHIVKFSFDGTVLWQKSLPNFRQIEVIGADNNGNVYVTYTFGGANLHLLKFNSAGVQQWIKGFDFTGYTGVDASFIRDIKIDSFGNIYLVGSIILNVSPNSNRRSGMLLKFNSEGVPQFQRKFGGSTTESISWSAVALDSSGNIYCKGDYTNHTNSTTTTILVKYNSSGAVQWQYQFLTANSSAALTVDSQGNSYLTGGMTQTIFSNSISAVSSVIKINTSGVFQWSTALYQPTTGSPGATSAGPIIDIDLDTAGNIILVGRTSDLINPTTNNFDILVYKLDSTGSYQWARLIEASKTVSGFVYDRASFNCFVSTDNLDNIIVNSSFGLTSDDSVYPKYLLTKVPSDGTKVGTYNQPEATYIYRDPEYGAVSGGSVTLTSSSFGDISLGISSVTVSITLDTVTVTPFRTII
jgi:hypothetical protein